MIKIKELTFGYKKNQPIFSDLNLSLNAGSVCGFLGKNGAGKTTLLKQICGLTFPQKGNCLVLGYNPKDRNPEFLEKIFIVPEEFEMPSMSICSYEKLYSPFYKNFDHNQFDQFLKDFEVDKNNKIQNLSFGQKKKIMLSFGIATNTPILILDEPTNGLDIPSKSTFRKIVASTINEERLILISTHQVRDLDSLIDNVIIVHENKIAFNHSIEEITNKLCFKHIVGDSQETDIIFHDNSIFGVNAISKNTNNCDTRVDLELLFGAVISNNNTIINHLKN
ncbi:MAG: ABC transporter ATP-binding protein [Bacteroidota bacterium]